MGISQRQGGEAVLRSVSEAIPGRGNAGLEADVLRKNCYVPQGSIDLGLHILFFILYP